MPFINSNRVVFDVSPYVGVSLDYDSMMKKELPSLSTLEELPDITEQVKKVLAHSQGVSNPNIEQIMLNWKRNKNCFFNRMGKLIWESEEQEFTLNDSACQSRINDFLTDLEMELRTDGTELLHFIEANRNDFYSGHLENAYILPDGTTIPKGAKIIKSFKYFIKDKTQLEWAQNVASTFIQENRIKGKLCLSIHPLDYLSLSDNTYNWRSCHALNGEYRAGNLSYMQDGSTIVCYIKTQDQAALPRFPKDVLWNNKKWRMLLFVADDLKGLFAGRQYPYNLESARTKILNMAKESLKLASEWSIWSNKGLTTYNIGDKEIPLTTKYFLNGGKLSKITDMVIDGKNSCHFNDLLHSSCYKPFYAFALDRPYESQFNIGLSVPCIRCGEQLVSRGHDCMVCSSCRSVTECVKCGTAFDIDEEGRCLPEGWVCPDCLENFYYSCPTCHLPIPNEEAVCPWCNLSAIIENANLITEF